MASNIAHRRAAKTAHRKRVLASRRAAEPVSLADKVRRAAAWPLYRCLLHDDIVEGGIGTVFLARRSPDGEIVLAAFLVDLFSLGIKDVVFQHIEESEFESVIASAGEAAPLYPVDPCYARKLLREAAAYAASLGLRPYRGFAAVELLFGEVRAWDCTEEFQFGCDGKPRYVVGPGESIRQVARRVGTLVERLGAEGFDFVIPVLEDEGVTDADAEDTRLDRAATPRDRPPAPR